MIEQVAEAAADLDNSVTALQATRERLCALPESQERTNHLAQIDHALKRIAQVRGFSDYAWALTSSAKGGLPKDIVRRMGKSAALAAVHAMNGATAMLSGINFGAQAYIARAENGQNDDLMTGFFTAGQLAMMGGFFAQLADL